MDRQIKTYSKEDAEFEISRLKFLKKELEKLKKQGFETFEQYAESKLQPERPTISETKTEQPTPTVSETETVKIENEQEKAASQPQNGAFYGMIDVPGSPCTRTMPPGREVIMSSRLTRSLTAYLPLLARYILSN